MAWDYNWLHSQVAEYLVRPDITDARIDQFISLGEARMNRKLRVRAMETRARRTGEGSRRMSLPDKFLEMRRLWLLADIEIPINYVGPDALVVPYGDVTGQYPSQFTVYNILEYDAPIIEDWEVEMVYYQKVGPLSATNPMNDVLSEAPSMYLMAALTESVQYTHDTERGITWAAAYQGKKDEYMDSDKGGRYSGSTLYQTPSVTPV